MSINQPLIKEANESRIGWQIYLLWIIAAFAIALLILPVLPGLVANFVYSFSGEAPKIYWYLSRASGIVSFTILWVSMALGLGITNKMARQWPGAPSAFAIHQYTSLLGLAFAIYHGLVLMGDHFVDFSLPRLMMPFSIAYETFWIGLGQLAFYIWLLVVLSFYIRQKIGQKSWRMIHYLNFAVYGMALMHGLRTGTDSGIPWAAWYFRVSAISLAILLAYRVYEHSLKNKISLPKFSRPRLRKTKPPKVVMDATSTSPTRPSISTRLRDLPLALLHAQAKKPEVVPAQERVLESISIQANSESTAPATGEDTIQQTAVAEGSTGQPPAEQKQDPVNKTQFTDVKKTVNGSVVTMEGMYQGKPIRVRIFGEPVTKPAPELKPSKEESKPSEKVTLINRLKNSFEQISVEPPSANRKAKHVIFSED